MLFVLVVFTLSGLALIGEALSIHDSFDRCLAAAASERLLNTGNDKQYICFPEENPVGRPA